MSATIYADWDGSGTRAMYTERDAAEIVSLLESGKYVRCDSQHGSVFVSPAVVTAVQSGRRQLPPSSAPSDLAQAEHRLHVSPTMG
jgi:hypothetical protein